MPFLRRARRPGGVLIFAACMLFACAGFAQTDATSSGAVSSGAVKSGAPETAGTSVSAVLQPSLLAVQHLTGQLKTARWKAPNEVKAAADRNLASIQRDLLETLPALLSQADASPGSVPPAFAVYRNVDALYDVLLRVSGTARLAAPEAEAAALESALESLESARKQLGEEIAAQAEDHEGQMVKLQAALKAATAAPPPPPKPALVDDGPQAPATKPATKKKRKTAKPATQPATQPSSSGSSAGAPTPPANPN